MFRMKARAGKPPLWSSMRKLSLWSVKALDHTDGTGTSIFPWPLNSSGRVGTPGLSSWKRLAVSGVAKPFSLIPILSGWVRASTFMKTGHCTTKAAEKLPALINCFDTARLAVGDTSTYRGKTGCRVLQKHTAVSCQRHVNMFEE